MHRFLGEVKRVLRPQGHFLFSDFRSKGKIDVLRRQLLGSGLTILREMDITPNVLTAWELDSERKKEMIGTIVGKPLRKTFELFTAVKDTKFFGHFKNGETVYMSFVLQKPKTRQE